MADTRGNKGNQDDDRKIPIFTVTKNGAILKNIFIVNNVPPPAISEQKLISFISILERVDQESEEISVVGRHPDCNIMLTHPSISRFHLQIHSYPCFQKLSVVDLSSVHGTWVSEKRIEPGVRVELQEGDVLKIGGSSRIYRLHWIPLSRACDFEEPFVSALDLSAAEQKVEEMAVVEETNDVAAYQEENPLLAENKEIESQDSIVECIDSLISDKNMELDRTKEIALAESMMMSSFLREHDDNLVTDNCVQKEISNLSSPCVGNESMNLSSADQQLYEENMNPHSHTVTVGTVEKALEETENVQCSKPLFPYESLSSIDRNEKSIPEEKLLVSEHCSSCQEGGHQAAEILEHSHPKPGEVAEAKTKQLHDVNQTPESIKEMYKYYAPRDEERDNTVVEIVEPTENQWERKEYRQKEFSSRSSVPLVTESVDSSLPDTRVILEVADNKECHTPQSSFATAQFETHISENSQLKSEKKSTMCSIWSRRGKPTSVLQIKTGGTRRKSAVATDRRKVNEETDNISISKVLFSHMDGEEEEIFTPDKENFTPNTRLIRSLKKKDILEESMHLKSSKSFSSKAIFSPDINLEDELDKENQTPKVVQEFKLEKQSHNNGVRLKKEATLPKSRAERMPFQSLQVNRFGTSRPGASALKSTTMSLDSVSVTQNTQKKNKSIGTEKRGWTMVADITSLLNKESMKSLHLLQGIKGTQLIIPRMVIRELDCLKRRGSFFRRTTEASLVLEWIEDCMVKTKWWIHVQNSVKDGIITAPTPPASPQSQYTGGSWETSHRTASSVPFTTRGSFIEIVSPTTEDHILDCALHFRKMRNDTQLVLLSNDLTLKIKAMAEGLICETAEEFRESLVNPFSSRFLWAASSPRGLTWSVQDDVVLKERYDNCHLKRSSKGGEGAKGLRLILLHNSHYCR